MQTIVTDLIETGMSEADLAEMIGNVSQPTIHRIKTGEIKNPRWLLGNSLVELHKQICGEAKGAA
ncbi:MAG: hypothetical protein ABW119_22575 [Candidatus Thiodiazotropha lotti]|nr:helix-turn-helix domain-containing protein [Candidatus Thiodiazotropha lotti]MCW4221936.1 helix-turn-helix domain-containing protein [Candidatus Thiodiazotropha lotti]